MTLFSPLTIAFVLFAAVTWLVSMPIFRRAQQLRNDMSAEDLETFRALYGDKTRRAEMPSRFQPLADVTAKATRAYLITVIVLMALILAAIFLGPNLGLPLGDAP
jgi:4-hydroxybenzoate polyprenyltransferase